jgi:hypothetical protein
MRRPVTAVPQIDTTAESTVTEPLAVRRRRESRRQEWSEQTKLAELLTRYLDPTCTFWTSLENKPISRISGIFQKRRGVRSGLPDVLVLYRGKTALMALHLEGVIFKRRWTPPKKLRPWEGPFSGAEERLPQHPVVAAERRAARLRWRERRRARGAAKLAAQRDDAAGGVAA